MKEQLAKAIEELLSYARSHLYLRDEDVIYVRNLLLEELKVEEPYKGEIDDKAIAALKTPDAILDPIREGYAEEGLSIDETDRITDRALGLLTPLPSEVISTFNGLYKKNPELSTTYLYDLSIENDYIKKSRVDKNILFDAKFEKGPMLEISINMSKPEKSNKDIAAATKKADVSYPRCLLCLENEGYSGRPGHPSRGNLRFVPLTLGGKRWYLQFSPYVYYREHCIVFLENHVPMKVDGFSLASLMDFADLFPHYFIGSNSDLPIVGGSILNHEHFQGGGHELPLLKAPFLNTLKGPVDGVVLHEVDFYDTVLCLEGKDKAKVHDAALKVIEAWAHYDNPALNIVSHDEEGRHSTSTIIVRKKEGNYLVYLILRNNRTDAGHPGGIFHARERFAHIKKEGIGLIEAAGLFILPSRLKRQSKLVEEAAASGLSYEEMVKKNPDLQGFAGMLSSLKHGLTAEKYIGGICRLILDDVSVFKKDEAGKKGLYAFLQGAGYGI